MTDNALYHLAVSGLTVEQLAQALLDQVPFSGPVHTDREIETYLAMISFQYVIPKDIAHIPVEKIIMLRKRLRDKHGNELETYQNYLHTLVSAQEELKQATNLATLHDVLEDEYVHKIKPQLDDLKKELRVLNIDTITGSMNLNITVPSSLATGAVLLGVSHLNPVVAGAGAIAMAVLKLTGDKQKKNEQALRSSPLAYLLRVEKGLKPIGLLSEISDQARRKFR